MENQKDPNLTREDALKSEITLMKMKLGLEFGMQMQELSTLSPDVESQWLKSVYAFEQQFAHAKKIKVYDYIGRPVVVEPDAIAPDQITKELQRVRVIMENHGLELDCICQYDDAIIYKFITEELFNHEMDDMAIPGMTYHFIYEEFHPNHDYDLREHSKGLIETIFTGTWNEQYHSMTFADKISMANHNYDRAGISSAITVFQDAHTEMNLKYFDIGQVTVDDKCQEAEVRGMLSASGNLRNEESMKYDGLCTLRFVRTHDYWHINGLVIPGLTKS